MGNRAGLRKIDAYSYMKLEIKHRSDGTALLHTWRTGQIYWGKNRADLLSDWTNLMHRKYCHHRNSDEILVHDSRRGIPAGENTFDAIYSCHVIEHLNLSDAVQYLGELNRVLKPGGVCRVSTPDLAREAREYVRQLDRCLEEPNEEADRKYELAVRALIDQFARQQSGGELLAIFRSSRLDKPYAFERYGDVYREFLADPVPELVEAEVRSTSKPTKGRGWRYVFDRVKLGIIRRLTRGHPFFTGETDMWEWDQYSLGKAFLEAGFNDVKVHTYDSSEIPDWDRYQLDTSFDNETPIECSLYMEARRPK